MMMPANYSAIAENEMTYVVGGGLLEAIGSVTAPVWGAANVKTFNTNLIQIVGNTFTPYVIAGTLGNVFGGHYLEKDYVTVEGEKKRNTIFGKDKTLWNALDAVNGNTDDTTNGFNKFLAGIGALASVYTLGTTATKSYVGENVLGIGGGEVKA